MLQEFQALPIQSKFFPLMTRKHVETLVKKLPFDRESFLWAQSAVVTRNFQGWLNLISLNPCGYVSFQVRKQNSDHHHGLSKMTKTVVQCSFHSWILQIIAVHRIASILSVSINVRPSILDCLAAIL